MALQLRDCTFHGPALPEPFVKFELEKHLNKAKLLPKVKGKEGNALQRRWEVYRRKLRRLGHEGGSIKVANHIFEPLVELLGYSAMERAEEVSTREGEEEGGWLLTTESDDARLRVWSVEMGADLDAPSRRGRAYRFSPGRVAQRVLLASGERVGVLTDGEDLRLLICDPARPESHIAVHLHQAAGWRTARQVPDSFRLILALASPGGTAVMSDLTDKARLTQTKVTEKLRVQARRAVEGFVQELLEQPDNAAILASWEDKEKLAGELWREGLVLVYRLLFVFKLESSSDPARAFSFASSSLWRNSFSPTTALAPVVREVLDKGGETGRFLESSLRTLFRIFAEGMTSSGLKVSPLGGMLFGRGTTKLFDELTWGERAVANLLDNLLWTPGGGKAERMRVHYGPLDVEDLGRVYEALLELEPGITSEAMCRLRRQKLEVVVPAEQGGPYKGADKKSKVQWVENIPSGKFYLRVGLGRKASGSYYTPHPFVRFLVQETLGPQVAERSPTDDPDPNALLKLKVLDPAMGSGHFLVEACRFLGDQIYEACRLCDELSTKADQEAEQEQDEEEKKGLRERARELHQRVVDLPDPDDVLVAYLPSHAPEGERDGLSQFKALAICRRLAAVHCLYGVDKNPLAVELSKLSLWLESYAEGLPLTFMDHRLICGDSLTGPFFEHLLTYPVSGEPIEGVHVQGFTDRLTGVLAEALTHVKDLEASVGKDFAELEQKRAVKMRLDGALKPLKKLVAAWTGAVMLGEGDYEYETLLRAVVKANDLANVVEDIPSLRRMLSTGQEGVPFDLEFSEVFHSGGLNKRAEGFHVVVGNPPWDALQPLAKEFYAAFDLRVLDAPTRLERKRTEERLSDEVSIQRMYTEYVGGFEAAKRLITRVYKNVNRREGGRPSGAVTDIWQAFAERGLLLLQKGGAVGWVLPSAFHANQSATGIRNLYLSGAELQCCYSFENRKKIFNIHSSFKFSPIVARRSTQGTGEFPCAFYLHDMDWLFENRQPLRYSVEFIKRTGGEQLTFLQLRSPTDASIANAIYSANKQLGDVIGGLGIRFSEGLHMSKASHLFTPLDEVCSAQEDPRDPEVLLRLNQQGWALLHDDKTFHMLMDLTRKWRPRYVVGMSVLPNADKKQCGFYATAYRRITGATNERTCIVHLIPPGTACGNTVYIDRGAPEHPTALSLIFVSVMGSFSFDWCLRLSTATDLNKFIVYGNPVPPLKSKRFLAHQGLRLVCNHVGYAPLWKEQVGDVWFESKSKHSWPTLETEDERWAVRSGIDAVVADAYGLSREQYTHVLSTFSHKSYPRAPEMCLSAFEELQEIGLEAFKRKHDPYWDVPLNESLPQPVIELPGVDELAIQRAKTGKKKAGTTQLNLLDRIDQAQAQIPEAGLSKAAEIRDSWSAQESSGDDLYDLAAQLLHEKGVLTNKALQNGMGLTPARARALLKQLVEEGKARVKGKGRGTRYVWNNER